MAVGDFVILAETLNNKGAWFEVSGTLEADSTLRAFDILPDKHIKDFTLTVNDVVVNEGRIILNSDATPATDKGSVAIDAAGAVNANWTATFR